jgi:hypothetical protein
VIEFLDERCLKQFKVVMIFRQSSKRESFRKNVMIGVKIAQKNKNKAFTKKLEKIFSVGPNLRLGDVTYATSSA